MAYFTSQVDANGALQFRKDIYDLDDKMLALLFKKEDYQLYQPYLNFEVKNYYAFNRS